MKINLTFVDGLIDIKIFFNPNTNNTSSIDFSSMWEVQFVWFIDCEWDNLNFHPSTIFVWYQYFET